MMAAFAEIERFIDTLVKHYFSGRLVWLSLGGLWGCKCGG